LVSASIRNRPSFPTRRSSDLDAIFGAETLNGFIMEPNFIPATARAAARDDQQAHSSATAEPPNTVAVRSAHWIETDRINDRLAEDRKSTRLNSSHVSSSYADS